MRGLKRLICTAALLAALIGLITQANSQGFYDTISIDDFGNWASEQNLPGYNFMQYDSEGDADYGEEVSYSAVFSGNARMLNLGLESASAFGASKLYVSSGQGEKFELGGHDAVYVKNEGARTMSFVYVSRPDLAATLTIMTSPAVSIDELKDLYAELDFSGLAAGGAVSWPGEIAAESRLNCKIISIEKQKYPSDGYSSEFAVQAVMSDALLDEISRLTGKFGGELYSMKTPGVDVVCAEAETLDDLKAIKNPGETVEFRYYVK